MVSNNAPAVSLELDADEAKWLHSLLSKSHTAGNEAFKDVCSMSSADPRSRFRSMLMVAANVDQITSEQLAERMQSQMGSLSDTWEKDRSAEKEGQSDVS